MSRQTFKDTRDTDERDYLERNGGTQRHQRGKADSDAYKGNKQKPSAEVKLELTDLEADENQPGFSKSAQRNHGQQTEHGTNDEIKEGSPT